MASVYNIDQVEPVQSCRDDQKLLSICSTNDTEFEYEMIGDNESIEILTEPGDGTDDSSDFDANIFGCGQPEDTDDTDTGRTDAATGEGSVDIAEEMVKLIINPEKDVHTNKQEASNDVKNQAEEKARGQNLHEVTVPAGDYSVDVEVHPSTKGNTEDSPLQAESDNHEGTTVEPVQSNAATLRPRDAQNQENKDDKFKPEDTMLPNAHSVISKVIESNTKYGVLLKCLDESVIPWYGRQYIILEAPMNKRIDQLGFTARLSFCNLDIKLHNEGCLMATDDNFLAKVRILDTKLVVQTNDFATAKTVLLEQLRIVDVLQDDLMSEKQAREKRVLQAVQTALDHFSKNEELTVDCIQLTYMINTHGRLDFVKFCEKITNNRFVSQVLCLTAVLFLLAEDRYNARSKILARFDYRQLARNSVDWLAQLRTMLNKHVTAYREQLLEKAPTSLYPALSSISNDRIVFVQKSDVKLFSDLAGVLDEKMFQKPLVDLAAHWIYHFLATKIEKLLSIEPQINPIFFFLAKSLEDLIVEISSRTNHTIEELLISDHSGWFPIKKITWKSENVLTRCIEREYFFIFKLLKHFDLGSCYEKKPFEYDIKLFEGQKQQPIWKKLVKDTKKFFHLAKASGNSPKTYDEKYVWYYLLDDVLHHVLPAECKLDSFEQVFRAYIEFLNKAGHDQLETLRVITHNTVRFIVQTIPYVAQKDSSSIDGQILQKQLDLINAKSLQRSLSSNNFRDLVDVFNIYWKNRADFIAGLPRKIDLPEMMSLKTNLLEIVSLAMEKNVSPEATVSFLRTYSDLLADLNEVEFDWYIKGFPEVNMDLMVNLKIITLINNKWASTINQTYSVVAVEKFTEAVKMFFVNYPYPKHYILEILLTLMSYIKNQLQKTCWTSGGRLSEAVQISTTNELIVAVRNSFVYLKEQPEYVSFETFLAERINPFASATANSSSHRDFTNRIYLIKESFWYIRKQNEIDIDKGLELFADLNAGYETEVLRSAYQKYADFFERFMGMCRDVSEYTAQATNIANKVKEITFVKPHQTWNSSDKLEKIPEILAGLAVVWSILVSKDVSSSGKYLTPHCIQILCILRLFSVDRAADGLVNHLSQVLTGQGKSLVLGLTAALLALTGHKARIVCYNEYLVTRDRQDFQHFISLFDLGDSIVYSTFDDMANDLIAPVVNGECMGLRDLVRNMLLGNEQPNRNEFVAEDMRKSVLLIDEVDVFFTPQFYGNEYRAGCRLMLSGLDLIQQEIWNIVSQRECRDVNKIIKAIYSYVDSEEMKKEEQFHKFIANEKHYKILVWRDEKLDTERYTNRQLFDEHLKKMINCALEVSLPANKWDNYKLSARGTILHRSRGKFVNTTVTYYMVFNYFRLRGSNFSTVVENEINYGYLDLGCGTISYTNLPKSYPLILGVSGTLADLNQYEKQSINNLYEINEMSLMPTYFGGSNLGFDQSQDVRILPSVSEWKTEIFARVNTLLGAHRSVLVFFESDVQLNSFHDEYCSQFDRLNVLTENTEPALMNQFIDEAGVAKTITLATSGMGRGVDYKSSVAIEKYGGLHVIQTFFSLDVKEERQIKGRTARKDNHGSYELIICKSHLDSADFCGDSLTYDSLHEARLGRGLKDNERTLKSINDCQPNHDTTMTYMKSFFHSYRQVMLEISNLS